MEKHDEKKIEETTVPSEDIEISQPAQIAAPITPQDIQVAKEVQVEERRKTDWVPKTSLGRQVLEGKITNIDQILLEGKKIIEPEIVDYLVPALQSDLILIGGRPGKGGGIKRIPIRITAKMHSSGRRFKTSSFFVVGDGNGLIGVGRGASVESRTAMGKALKRAKLNIIRIKRGCGDWECGCGTEHSIPFKTEGHAGSVRVHMMPAPKGVGLVADNETKKLLKLSGIKDIWIKTFGNTSNRVNLIYAMFHALKRLYVYEK